MQPKDRGLIRRSQEKQRITVRTVTGSLEINSNKPWVILSALAMVSLTRIALGIVALIWAVLLGKLGWEEMGRSLLWNWL